MASGGSGNLGTPRLIELIRHEGKADDPLVRQQLADIFINGRVASYTNLRAMAKIAAGQLPGPEMSIAKLSLTMNMRRISELRLLGPRPPAGRRHGRVGHLRLVQVRPRPPRDAHGRRDRRGPPQHHRRACPRTAEGAGAPDVRAQT